MISSIGGAFEKARSEGRRALIGFMTAGYPSPKDTVRLCRALIDGGVDILELGIPFSDPIADGPTIQVADVGALSKGTNVNLCLDIARSIRNEWRVPMVFLTYYNPIFRFGLDRFMTEASNCVEGLVVPDLPELESKDFKNYKEIAENHDLATILLAAPTTTEKKLGSLLKGTNGFLYLVSLTGVTGEREGASQVNLKFIERVSRRARGKVNVAVGFGISNPQQVRGILETGADGVIIGSAFIKIVTNHLDDLDSATSELTRFAQSLKEATKLTESPVQSGSS